MRHLFFLVAVAIVDVIIAIDHGGMSNNVDVDEIDALISSGEAPTGQETSVQYREGQVTDAEDRGGNAGEERMGNLGDDVHRRTGNTAQEWMSNLRDDGNRRTGNVAQEWMSNLGDDVHRRTGNAAQEWMSSLGDDVNRKTGKAAQEWMNNVQDDVNRKTGKAAQEWMNNVRDDVNRKTGKAAQEWMSHVRDDVNRRTGKAAQEWMSHVRDDVNRKTGNAAQEWMSNLRDDGNRRTGNAAQEWMNNLSKGKATNHRNGVNRRTDNTGTKRTGNSTHGKATHGRNRVNRRRGNGRRNQHSTQFNKNPRQESSCPRDFVYNAKLKFCFKVIFERSSTYSAKKKCKRMVKGGRLVQPDTRDKLMELTKTISSKNHGTRSSFAIGSTKNRGRDYTWMDGSPMKYANWCLGSPNKGKACVTLTSQRRGSDMCMDDGCCYHRGKFICEKPIAY